MTGINSKNHSTSIVFAFLLAMFLLFNTSCTQQPQALDKFIATHKLKETASPVVKNRTMNICLGSNNKVLYYLGDPDKPRIGPNVTGYGKDSLHKVIITNRDRLLAAKDTMIVLIKTSDKSTYDNFVKTVAEMASCNIKHYGVVDITSQEINLLKKQRAF